MMLQAVIPHGVHPGQSFSALTPNGPVSLVVPPGACAGQSITFQTNHAGATSVVAGTSLPLTGSAGAWGHKDDAIYRVDPKQVSTNNLPITLQGIPVGKVEEQIHSIQVGSKLAQENPPFPGSRRFRDVAFIFPFIAVVAVVIVAAVAFGGELSKYHEERKNKHGDHPSIWHIILAGGFGSAASLIAAIGVASLARNAPGCLVWTSLLGGPCLMILLGACFMLINFFFGIAFIALGALSLFCVFFCYRPFIPFTIRIVELVGRAMRDQPMIGISAVGSIVGGLWSMGCGFAFIGAYVKHEEHVESSSDGAQYGMFFVVMFVWYWGAYVVYNVCHVTYCGVFGRWYHHVDTTTAISASAKVALGTSFGSICFGSFLVAVIRALEATIRQARRAAAEDGNVACCILLLVTECVVSCLGSLLEYFSEWAYVQCAVRGVGFVTAARITYSMMTCANMQYVISDLLIDTVVSMGALFCAAVGSGTGAGVGYSLAGSEGAITGAIIGVFAGFIAGGAAVGIMASGSKTILSLWAEDPEPLRRRGPDLHDELENKLLSKM